MRSLFPLKPDENSGFLVWANNAVRANMATHCHAMTCGSALCAPPLAGGLHILLAMNHQWRKNQVFFLAAWLAISSSAYGDAEFRLSSDNSATEQNHPTVAVAANGRFLVAWEDLRNGNGDIYCRSFSADGVALAQEFIINDDSIGAVQAEPDLVSDWIGNGYLVWKDYRHYGYPFGPDVYFQKLDSTGPVGTSRLITAELPDSSRQSPAVGASGWGRTMVVWSDLRNQDWDIYGQGMDAAGIFAGSNRKLNDDGSTTPNHAPGTAVSANGWSVVVWYDGRSGNDDIYLQKCDSLGQPMGGNIRVNSDGGTTRQKFPAVAIGGTGTITVVWTDWRSGTYPANPDIYGQRFDAALNRLGNNFKISLDGTQAAQRDPKVAADRMGNAVVVWSDSAGGDWNVGGQVFDAAGKSVGANFVVNQIQTGRQVFPDVALDGHRMYLAWTDNRSGEYDVYGRVITYNTPGLLATPSMLELSCDRLEGDTTVAIAIENAGYGEIPFRLRTDEDWIDFSDSLGTTPDTIPVTIRPGSLAWGTHAGRITLTDLVENDSTVFVPITLSVTGPMIIPQPDSFSFRALAEVGSPANQALTIINSGSGSLNWQATTTASWLHVTPSVGSDGDSVTIGCDIASLATGNHQAYIVLTDSLAVNSPESVLVALNIAYGLAYLTARPDTIFARLAPEASAADSIQIINLGGEMSHWQPFADIPWLICDSSIGSDDDFLRYRIETGEMSPARYSDSLLVVDSAAFNNPLYVPIILDIYEPDTISVPPAIVEMGKAGQVPIWLCECRSIDSGRLTLSYDPKLLAIDSVVPTPGSLPGRLIVAGIDPVQSLFTLEISVDSEVGPREPGRYQLADVFVTANDSLADSTVFQSTGAESFYLVADDRQIYHPALNAGLIEISYPTSVEGQGEDHRPAGLLLGQNIPNPFNGATRIAFSLDRAGRVQVDVYNLLGQRIRRLVDDILPVGSHQTIWDGRDQAGRPTASGIYFYALSTSEATLVRKMVYLK